MVALAENVGSNTIDAVKAQIQNQVTETEVPGVGDRASFFRAANSDSLLVARGAEILTLSLLLREPTERRRQDLLSLAREALASDFDGWKVVKYEVAERALTDDRGAFETDPKNFAALLVVMRKFDEARTYNLRALTAHPDDADALYLQGVLDWVLSYQPGVQLRSQLGLAPWQSLEGPACAKIRSANLEKVNEGLEMLSKAVKLRPDFDDAMAYTALLYREHADYQCSEGATRSTDLRTADEWFDKARASKQANVGKNRTLYGLVLLLPPPPPPDLPSSSQSASASPGSPMGGVIGGIISSTPCPRRKLRTRIVCAFRWLSSRDF
jgi:tetratricopeptide (TPR) repeat protein